MITEIKRSLGRRGPNVDGVTYLSWSCEPTVSGLKSDHEFVVLDIVATPMIKLGDERISIGASFASTVTILRNARLGKRAKMDILNVVDEICCDYEYSRDAP